MSHPPIETSTPDITPTAQDAEAPYNTTASQIRGDNKEKYEDQAPYVNRLEAKKEQDKGSFSSISSASIKGAEKESVCSGELKVVEEIDEIKAGESDKPTKSEEVPENAEEKEEKEIIQAFRSRNVTPLRLSDSSNCFGILGKLEAQTCANRNAAAEELEFLTKINRHGGKFRVRPKTPIRQIVRRNLTNAQQGSQALFEQKCKEVTKLVSPVVGDETLATLIMNGFSYSSPMSRCLSIPVISVDDGIKDDDLESHICNECIFCEREKVRHHKTRQNEQTFVRQLRSPCRCFHEHSLQPELIDIDDGQEGKKYIMERFVNDDMASQKIEKNENEVEVKNDENKDSEEQIEEIDNQTSPVPVEAINEKKTEESASSGIRKRASCHGHTSSLPAKRISVITPNASSERSSQVSTSTGQPHGYPMRYPPARFPENASHFMRHPLPMHMRKNPFGPPHFPRNVYRPRPVFHPVPNAPVHIKQEHPASLNAYAAYNWHKNPNSNSSNCSNYTLPANPQRANSMHSFASEPTMSHPGQQFAEAQAPDTQQVFTEDQVSQMLEQQQRNQSKHPLQVERAISRLAGRYNVSRNRPEKNERQVTELLNIALEVRKEEGTESAKFYCPWEDCSKSFNRRDSLVRHLRVHVNVRPFKCERCDQTFLRSDHLRVHMLRHTGEQPFACIVCGATFSRRDLRNHHMKATHYPDERPPQRVLELLEGVDWDSIQIGPPNSAFNRNFQGLTQ